MIRCIAKVLPLRKNRCCNRRANEFAIELQCDKISDAELRAERYAIQNEEAVRRKLKELAIRRKIFCKMKHCR